MQLFQSFILLIIGFVFLIKGADFFVDGSASIAKQLRVPSLIVGMTVVAMGTSLPECSVSVTASLAGNNSLAISNVVGSIYSICSWYAECVPSLHRSPFMKIHESVIFRFLSYVPSCFWRPAGWKCRSAAWTVSYL